MHNARFLELTPSAQTVKLTLRPGQELRHSAAWPTDEGYHSEETRWWYEADEGYVYREHATYDRDCDGPLDRFATCRCAIDKLAARPGHEDYEETRGLFFPEWQRVSASQRDHYAEAMGY